MITPVVALVLAQTSADAAGFDRARQLVQEGRGADGLPVLSDLAARFPRSPEIRFFLGSALGQAGRRAEAIEHLRVAVELDPKFQPAFRVLGMFRVESGLLQADTRAVLERAAELDPEDARAHYWLGRFFLETKSPAAARACFERSLKIDRAASQTRLGLGLALELLGETDAALAAFDAVLRAEPRSPLALLGRARCLYRKQQTESALAAVLEAGRHGAADADRRGFHWIRSRIYRALGRDAEAEQDEQTLAGIEAGFNQRLARFRDLVEQAEQFRQEGNRRMVVEALEMALRIEENRDALVRLGDTYAEMGRYAEAERCFVRAGQIGPETGEITRRLRLLRERMSPR